MPLFCLKSFKGIQLSLGQKSKLLSMELRRIYGMLSQTQMPTGTKVWTQKMKQIRTGKDIAASPETIEAAKIQLMFAMRERAPLCS